jgi:hypothetical protein
MVDWLKLCFSKSVVRRACTTALIVGAILVAINYGDIILRGQITLSQALRMALTFCVPYCVSTFSSVSAIRNMRADFMQKNNA